MNALEFRVISENEVNRFEQIAHNPPTYTDVFTEEDFSDEWWATRTMLKERIELFGEEWQLPKGTGDFMLSETRGNSRWVYITFTSTRLWRPEFVLAVSDLLTGLSHDYRVGCLTELNDEELLEQPLVYLVISSTTVFGNVYETSSEVLRRFGFP